jgi:predicted hotdog family 3-hydroxylacyl-ACP dehydratase
MLIENILQLIPMRHPFVMIDKLLLVNNKSVTSNFIITAENIFCENGYFSEAGLLENIAQTAAAGNGYNEQIAKKKVSGGFIIGVKNFEVFFLPEINDILTTNIIVTDNIFNIIAIAGKIVCNYKLAAQCEMKIFSNTNY